MCQMCAAKLAVGKLLRPEYLSLLSQDTEDSCHGNAEIRGALPSLHARLTELAHLEFLELCEGRGPTHDLVHVPQVR